MTNTTRRQFLALLGTGIAISSLPALAQPGPGSGSDRKIGVALLGLGNYSQNLLAPALQHTRHCELRGIITGSPEKVPVWQARYGIPDSNVYSYDDMHRVADNPDIDVVYVVVPTGLHMKYAVRAANAGKHVWCEKPMAMNVEECQAIIEACDKNAVKLSIGYRMQHEPNTIELASYRTSKPFGAMQSVRSFAGYGGSGLPASNWRMQKHMGGGALYDMGVYPINGARYITGLEPVAVTGRHENPMPQTFTEVDATTYFTLEFANGMVADCGTSVVESFNELKVTCEDGWYQLSPMQSYSGVTGTTSSGERLPAISGMQQTLQMDNDARAILDDSAVMVPGEEGLKDIRLVNAIFAAAKSGQRVTI